MTRRFQDTPPKVDDHDAVLSVANQGYRQQNDAKPTLIHFMDSKKGTIERQLAKDNTELGLKALLRLLEKM
jgi:hypothetical protein